MITLKFTNGRPYADPDKAARRIMEIANTIEPAQGKLYIELINYPMLFKDNASPADAWLRGLADVARGGTFVKFTPAGADLFA